MKVWQTLLLVVGFFVHSVVFSCVETTKVGEPPIETSSVREAAHFELVVDASVEQVPERAREQVVERGAEPEPSRGPALSAETTKQLADFFQKYGGKERFSPGVVESLTTFLTVEELYFAGRYEEAQQQLDALWAKYPLGTSVWSQQRPPDNAINIGLPTAYYGLRMLKEMVRFRLKGDVPSKPATITMTVLLVDCLQGVQPTTMQELNEGKGKNVTLSLDKGITANNHFVVQQSLRLFLAYIQDITGGKLQVKVHFQPIKHCAQGYTSVTPYRVASIRDVGEVFAKVPSEVRSKTSWWWVVYPSLIPEQYPDFKTTEFISGGMGVDPSTGAPCFIVDDRWLLRKPPHLGQGQYSEIERRTYLPQWLQHEFFHHLYRVYPSFELEKRVHQWFDRKTWPADFVGQIEPDYYAESLNKRLQTDKAQPPLHIKLRYDAPPPELYQKLEEKDFIGSYKRLPVTNGWHEGTISKSPGGGYVWRNKANVSWNLTWEQGKSGLATDSSCPYYGQPGADQFRFVFKRGNDGAYTPEVTAFGFFGETYIKSP